MTPETTNNTPEEVAFIGHIRTYPEDATARLAFADWLDEHGHSSQANYLRAIRHHKFVRMCGRYGVLYALYPQHLIQMPRNGQRWNQKIRRAYWGHQNAKVEGNAGIPITLSIAMREIEAATRLDAEPPAGHDRHKPYTERCEAWVEKINRGWKPPKHIKRNGYSMMVEYFGVLTWEYLDVILKLLWSRYGGPQD